MQRALSLVLALVAVGMLCVAGGVPFGSSSNAEPAPVPVLGLLGASPTHFAAERAAGVQAVTVQVGWDDAEPTAGSLSSSYMAGIDGQISEAEHQGLQVILDLGSSIHRLGCWPSQAPKFVNRIRSRLFGK